MYDYENYYEEYSEFDAQVEEFKDSLKQGLKQEIKDELERLRKENEELQDVKNNYKNIKRDYDRKVSELKWEKEKFKEEFEHNFLQMKYSEVIEQFGTTVYRVERAGFDKGKCNLCDENRKYLITTPDGTKHEFKCSCSNLEYTYVAEEITILKITLCKERREKLRLQLYYGKRNADYGDSEFIHTVYDTFEKNNVKYRTAYRTKKEAQKHADYLNSKEE